jgi:hypothetical protein
MKYYQKNAELFYKMDEETKTYVEIFRSPLQKRILVVYHEPVYNATMNRILNNGFTVISEESFTNAYNIVKSEI